MTRSFAIFISLLCKRDVNNSLAQTSYFPAFQFHPYGFFKVFSRSSHAALTQLSRSSYAALSRNLFFFWHVYRTYPPILLTRISNVPSNSSGTYIERALLDLVYLLEICAPNCKFLVALVEPPKCSLAAWRQTKLIGFERKQFCFFLLISKFIFCVAEVVASTKFSRMTIS